MFGLARAEWQDLVLSVNIHRKTRRLTPMATADLLLRASSQASLNDIAEALALKDTGMLRKFISLTKLPAEIASAVEWGERRGSISMSAAAEIARLGDQDVMKCTAVAAIQNSLTKDEIRQVIQIKARSAADISDCIQRVLSTRPLVERSELVLGSIMSEQGRAQIIKLGPEVISRKIQNLMARDFPDVVPKALRINNQRFSLLLSGEGAKLLREQLRGKTIEMMITGLAEQVQV